MVDQLVGESTFEGTYESLEYGSKPSRIPGLSFGNAWWQLQVWTSNVLQVLQYLLAGLAAHSKGTARESETSSHFFDRAFLIRSRL